MILHPHKIIFAGSMGAGKSAAIQSLSDIPVFSTEAINTDHERHNKMFTTVGIDYGEITLDDDIKVGLYGTPGQERFDFIWSTISQGALGTIILIDHSAENPLRDIDFYYKKFIKTNSNLVFAITHIDEKSKVHTSQYREWIAKHEQTYPLYFIDARKPEDILLLIDTLLSQSEISLSLSGHIKHA